MKVTASIKPIVSKTTVQAKLDAVFSEIREIKLELKEINNIDPYLVQQTRQARIAIFQDKLRRYKILLAKTRLELDAFAARANEGSIIDRLHYYFFQQEEVNKLEQKEKILVSLVEVAEKLSVDPTFRSEQYLGQLEHKLDLLLRGNEYRLVHHNLLWLDEQAELEKRLKALRKHIISYRITLGNLSCRDLRQAYRTLIRFLFKNMDDQSGDSSVLFAFASSNHIVPSLTRSIYEQRSGNLHFTRNSKY